MEQSSSDDAQRKEIQDHEAAICTDSIDIWRFAAYAKPKYRFAISSRTTQAQEQTPRPTLTPIPRLTLTPVPTNESGPEPSPREQSPDIQWSQAASLVQSTPNQSILAITIRAVNVGRGDGGSNANLSYDSKTLRLLDVTPTRTQDWVRNHDEAAGMLTLALGRLAPNEQTTMQVQFLVLRMTTTTIRTVRDDGLDRANPLFLSLENPTVGPIKLTWQQKGAIITILGRGYKPGEQLSLWMNTRQNVTATVKGEFSVLTDNDGSINLMIPFPDQDVVSIVVYGRRSDVTGIVEFAQLP